MTRWEHYIDRTETIINQYNGTVPLHRFLKDFFKRNPKMGSNDRRQVSQLTYGYFRLGKAGGFPSVRDRILTGIWLFPDNNAYLDLLPPFFQGNNSLPLSEKIKKIPEQYPDFRSQDLFPWSDLLSAGIDSDVFTASLLAQPSLFLRIRIPLQGKSVLRQSAANREQILKSIKAEAEQSLVQNKIPFQWKSDTCLQLPNGTKAEQFLSPEYFEIQDYSSQKTATFFNPQENESWWDCCAASGGKSLLLKDLVPSVKLTVSDIRSSILNNLTLRFKKAGHKIDNALTLDLVQDNLPDRIPGDPFDGILIDAPCSGSGTWSRTPENLYFFSPDNLVYFQERQLRIARNIIRFLKPGGTLIYITCSVFQAENEHVIEQLLQSPLLRLEKMTVLNGTHDQADSMFIARLKKMN